MHRAPVLHDAPDDFVHWFFDDEFLAICERHDGVGRLLDRLDDLRIQDKFAFLVRLGIELCQLDQDTISQTSLVRIPIQYLYSSCMRHFPFSRGKKETFLLNFFL